MAGPAVVGPGVAGPAVVGPGVTGPGVAGPGETGPGVVGPVVVTDVSADADRDVVARLLGREPLADFDVVVRRSDGTPVVIRNAPLLPDGRPMPTRYWLVDPWLNREIGRLEAAGGVDRAEADVGAELLVEAHRRYAAERDAAMPADHVGPRPSGGVGGTRTGVKCLHAHYANHLAGRHFGLGSDPVGDWVERCLADREVGGG